MTCDESGAGDGPFTAASSRTLTNGTTRLQHEAPHARSRSAGKGKELAESSSTRSARRRSHCTPRSPDRTNRKGSIAARVKRATTLVGRPVITGRVTTTGDYGQIVARLWDLDPRTSEQLLITRGAYRLEDDEQGAFRFTLDGNGWRFAKGHRVVVELVGRDAPTYGREPGAVARDAQQAARRAAGAPLVVVAAAAVSCRSARRARRPSARSCGRRSPRCRSCRA